MANSRDKGMRAELNLRDILRKKTGKKWERVPGSGALNAKHGLKGDLYIPQEGIQYCVEVKHYASDQLTSSLLTGKSPMIMQWWAQAVRQADEVSLEPLLFFKFDRSKWFVATEHNLEWISNLAIRLEEESPIYIYALLDDHCDDLLCSLGLID